MEQNIVKEGFSAKVNQLFLVHELLCDRGENLLELIGDLILEHDLLGPLLLADSLVVGEVECQGLDGLSGVTRGENQVDHSDWTLRPPVSSHFGRDREILLHVRQIRLKLDQFGRLDGIGDGDKRLEGCLQTKEPILIGLVGPNSDLNLGVQVHPVLVRLVVVIADEGLGPGLEEGLQAGVGSQHGGGHHVVVSRVQVFLEEGRVVLGPEVPVKIILI